MRVRASAGITMRVLASSDARFRIMEAFDIFWT